MRKPKRREVRHRIRVTNLGLIQPEVGYPYYRERFETKCAGEKIVVDADLPKLTVITQKHRDVEARSALILLRERLRYILRRNAVVPTDVVLNGNRAGLYWKLLR